MILCVINAILIAKFDSFHIFHASNYHPLLYIIPSLGWIGLDTGTLIDALCYCFMSQSTMFHSC